MVLITMCDNKKHSLKLHHSKKDETRFLCKPPAIKRCSGSSSSSRRRLTISLWRKQGFNRRRSKITYFQRIIVANDFSQLPLFPMVQNLKFYDCMNIRVFDASQITYNMWSGMSYMSADYNWSTLFLLTHLLFPSSGDVFVTVCSILTSFPKASI